ncbi:MAG: YybH family protein [Puniceicoccales bacterium]
MTRILFRTLATFLVAALALLSSCTHDSTTTAAQDPQVVIETLQAYVAGRQARDLETVESLLAPDVDQLTSRGEWRRGIEAATSGMKRSTATNPGDRSLQVETVRFLSPNVALADARYIIAGTDGPDRIIWSSFTLVRSSDGNWKITSIRNQLPSP